MDVPPDLVLVSATLLAGLSLIACIIGWSERRLPIGGLSMLGLGVALFLFVHLTGPRGLVWRDIPDAFILVAARVLA